MSVAVPASCASAEIVGNDGAVVGIDISSDLIDLCRRRSIRRWLSYAVGNATQVAQPDASFDVVVCTQVAEYVPGVNRVLSEAFRVLKPGGRAVFVATDWDTVVWHSDMPHRMASVLKSWESYCAHPRLPRALASRLVSAGFRFDDAVVFPILNLRWDDEAYSRGLAGLIRDFVSRKNQLQSEDLQAWYDELASLSESGRISSAVVAIFFERPSRCTKASCHRATASAQCTMRHFASAILDRRRLIVDRGLLTVLWYRRVGTDPCKSLKQKRDQPLRGLTRRSMGGNRQRGCGAPRWG